MNLFRRYAFIWSFKEEKERAYMEFTSSINFVSLQLVNALIIVGMISFIFVDLFRHVNYSFVLAARFLLAVVSLVIILYGREKKPYASSVELLMAFSLVMLVAFAYITAWFGQMPSFFLTNVSVTILVFVATISGLRLRFALLFNFMYLIILAIYTQIFQRDPFYFSQYSNLISMFLYSSLAGVLIEIRRRENFLQYEDLLLQKKKVEELNQQKNNIISVLSHDVASPINSLSGLLQLSSNAKISTSETNMLLKEVGHRLESVAILIHNLVRWSRSQMSGFVLVKKDIEAVSLLEEVIRFFQPQASEKFQELKLTSNGKIIINADEEMMRIVVRNLISNAIKSAKKNSTINIEALEDDQNHALIKVSNEGVPISPETKKKLFGHQTSSTTGTNGEKGTGLGLFMAAHFVTLNGGQLYLEDHHASDKEITFCVSMPSIKK